jgi:excisionase family DNA binding protein
MRANAQLAHQLTVREAAAALNISVHTVRSWIATRRIGFVRLGRAIRIPITECERIVDEGTVPAAEKR